MRLLKIINNNLRKVSLILKKMFQPSMKILPCFIERKRIIHYPRQKVFSSHLMKKKILISDSFWYLPTLDEIWKNQIYRFNAKRENPYIIDCGANIGLSVIYWKYHYPNSKIIAFEPDPKIFDLLRKNVEEFRLDNVELYPCAIWSSTTKLSFKSDNSVGGKLVNHGNDYKLIKVNTFRLRDLLIQNVDMLKIDIEGAEYEVILDCYENLVNVEHVFIEYHGATNEPQKLHNILEMLQDTGFRYHIKEANPVKHPFIRSELNKLYDLQLNIFAFKDKT